MELFVHRHHSRLAHSCVPAQLGERRARHSGPTVELSRFILPAPCSYRLMPGMRSAPSTSACFMLAGFRMPPFLCHLLHTQHTPQI